MTLTRVFRDIRRLVDPRAGNDLTDRDLLQRFVDEGDGQAFTMLVRRHGPMILTVCRQVVGNMHDAEDAFQATFMVLARKAAEVHWQESIASWLFPVAFHLALKMKAQVNRRRIDPTPVDEIAPAAPASNFVPGELGAILDEELSRLPEKYRAPLVLCHYQGRTRAEAAQQLGWKLGAVKIRLERGREMLRTRLTRRGLALSGGFAATALIDSAAMATPSAMLVDATAAAAREFATKNLSTALAASAAAQLAEGALKTMMWTKLKSIALVVLVVGLLGAGTGLLTLPAAADEAPTEKEAPKPMISTVPTPAKSVPVLAHGGRVGMLAFSPDGKLLATGGGGGVADVRVWSLSDGKRIAEFSEHRAGITGLVFTPDSTKLVSGGWDSQVIVWDLASGKEIRRFEHDEGVTDLCLSPDGKLLATGSMDAVVRVFDLGNGKELRRMALEKSGRDDVLSVSFSADGTAVGAVSRLGWLKEPPARVWEVATGKPLEEQEDLRRLARKGVRFRQFHAQAGFEQFSFDRHTIVQPGELVLVEGFTGQQRLSAPTISTTATAMAPDGRQIAWANDGNGSVHVASLPALAGVNQLPEALDASALEACWSDLRSDPRRAYRASWLLSAVPAQSVTLLRDKVLDQPDKVDPKYIDRLVADLDAPSFQTRQKAAAELEKHEARSLVALRKALAASPSLEFRVRAERILASLEVKIDAEAVRGLRGVEVLSRVATPEARQALEQIARGPLESGPDVEQAAAEALRRLNLRKER